MAVTRAFKNAINFQERTTATPLIINGDMQNWQRGTALSSSPGSYACDRFWYAGTGATSQRSTDVPSGKGFIYSNKLTYGSADMAIGQPIELPATGIQGNLISGQTLTVAFYGKVDSGTEGIGLAINFRNGKFDGTDQQAFTISDNAVTLTTAWQRFTKTFTIPTVHANNIMAAFEINGISKTAYFTGIQCELGTYDTNSIPDFQFEDTATSLARCQRYFERITTSGGGDTFGAGVCFVTTQARVDVRYSTVKRANATITLASASNFLVQAGNKTQAPTSLGSAGSSLHGFYCHCAVSGFTIGHGCVLLDNGTTDATIDVSSEL